MFVFTLASFEIRPKSSDGQLQLCKPGQVRMQVNNITGLISTNTQHAKDTPVRYSERANESDNLRVNLSQCSVHVPRRALGVQPTQSNCLDSLAIERPVNVLAEVQQW